MIAKNSYVIIENKVVNGKLNIETTYVLWSNLPKLVKEIKN